MTRTLESKNRILLRCLFLAWNVSILPTMISCAENFLGEDKSTDSEQEFSGATVESNETLPSGLTEADINSHTKILNDFRAEPQTCGGEEYPAVAALSWHRKLYDAAKVHSDDMLKTGKIGHTGSNGSSPFDRIKSAGYSYRAAAENVAGKMSLLKEAFDGWVASSGHCINMMRSQVKEFGLADSGGFWTLVLAGSQ